MRDSYCYVLAFIVLAFPLGFWDDGFHYDLLFFFRVLCDIQHQPINSTVGIFINTDPSQTSRFSKDPSPGSQSITWMADGK
jgi:hypothetical protein